MMKANIWRLFHICFMSAFLVCTLISCTDKQEEVPGWESFRKGAIEKIPFVKDVNRGSITQISLYIMFVLDENIDAEDADKLFDYTYDYITNKSVIESMLKLHTREKGSNLVNLYISSIYDGIIQYEFFSPFNKTEYSFTNWYAVDPKGNQEDYYPKTEAITPTHTTP